MSSSTTCSVVDAVLFDGALYIRKVNKDATSEEKKQRRAQYMKRYRSGRKAVKNTQKEQQKDGTEAQQEQADGQKVVGDSAPICAQPCVESKVPTSTGSARVE